MLRTENTAQATTVGREQLNALPINFAIGAGAVRNPLSFVQLSPGASISGWNMIRVNGAPSGTFKIIFEGQDSSSGLDAGVAYSADGNPRSGMGVDAADYDGDDLFVANFNRERFSLYRNRGNINFTDEAGCTGIGTATQMYSGWDVKFFDVDHDGDEDLIVCNSHPDDQIEKLSTTVTFKEPILLFENTNVKFNLMNARAGQAFEKNWPARGLAVGDLDNDGMPDLVIANAGEAPLILRLQALKASIG